MMAAAPSPEHRAAPRLPAAKVPEITGLRLLPFGVEGTLVNISATGALVESDRRVPVNAAVGVQFKGSFSPASVRGRIARCAVATVDRTGRLRFHVGIAFNSSIVVTSAEEEPAPAPSPAPRPRPATWNRW